MNILHVGSFHGRLDYDVLRVLNRLGHTTFDCAHWLDPQKPIDHPYRCDLPSLSYTGKVGLMAWFREMNPEQKVCGPIHLNQEFVSLFDLAVVSYCHPSPNVLFENWDVLRTRPVIFITYGQQMRETELKLADLKWRGDGKLILARNSPRECFITGFAGADVILRTLVDDEYFQGWAGGENSVLTFQNSYPYRELGSNTKEYEHAVRGLSAKLYGVESEGAPNYGGVLSREDQLDAYRRYDCYFALGSKPATLTYNLIEGMMVGMPTVTWGRKLGGILSYEAPDLFQHEEHLLFADSKEEARRHLTRVLKDPRGHAEMGSRARLRAQELFGWETTLRSWDELLRSI